MESIRLMNLIWDCQELDLGPNEVAVLLNVARFASDPGVSIPAARNRIVTQSRLSPTTVDKCFQALFVKRYLERVKEHTATRAAEYMINEKRLRGEE